MSRLPLIILLLSLLSPLLRAAPEDRAKLQIINGSTQPVDVFWLKPADGRVPNDPVQPGKDTIISTMIGRRFVIVGREDQKESHVTSEVPVQAFRVGGVPAFYTQQASAGGFPVVASAKVSPYALKEAVYIIDMMLARRPDVREAMVKSGARLCILAHNDWSCSPDHCRSPTCGGSGTAGTVVYAVFATDAKQQSAGAFAASARDLAWRVVPNGLPLAKTWFCGATPGMGLWRRAY